ncbi:unnamed protein product [Ambrosiozyma monospora]|uniref:Unnamed protein product n=1 Tax=Ambrosiozyma monospora TaxID=43982 RepID=A0A9W6Z4H2_AMBMO|nr:unnamed protein product [Ambrosiozyma monospora]
MITLAKKQKAMADDYMVSLSSIKRITPSVNSSSSKQQILSFKTLAKLKIDLIMAGSYIYLIPSETEAHTSFRKYLDDSKWVKKDITISRFGTQIDMKKDQLFYH